MSPLWYRDKCIPEMMGTFSACFPCIINPWITGGSCSVQKMNMPFPLPVFQSLRKERKTSSRKLESSDEVYGLKARKSEVEKVKS